MFEILVLTVRKVERNYIRVIIVQNRVGGILWSTRRFEGKHQNLYICTCTFTPLKKTSHDPILKQE